MIRIYIPEQDKEWLHSLLGPQQIPSLDIRLSDDLDMSETDGIWVSRQGIHLGPAWFDELPGYLFPDFLPAESSILQSLLNILLGLPEQESSLSPEDPTSIELMVFNCLLAGQYIPPRLLDAWRSSQIDGDHYREFRMIHNMAILLHYGNLTQSEDMPSLRECYEAAIETAPSPLHSGFSIKHFSTLLADVGRIDEAKRMLDGALQLPLTERARISLSLLYNDLVLDTMPFPLPATTLERLTASMWNCLEYLEAREMDVHIAMLLISASRVANLNESFSESLGYINRSLSILADQDLPELTGNALMQKGNLLYTWAQNGSPQFYRPAVETYQQAVKIFSKDHAPQIFATIQHHLAVLYSEMPDEHKKRHIWAAISVRSFEESLEFFTKEQYPYEYGMICNNFGNALMKFPPAKNADHTQMALDYYREALQVRQAAQFPAERALTLLNFLEASWKVGNPGEEFNQDRYEDMLSKASEIRSLTQEPGLLEEADRHLDMLDALIKTVEHA